MTASEDNLVLLRNKLRNPPLRQLFAQLALEPQWLEEQGRLLAYLAWPLELRGAVHRTLFPAGTPAAAGNPLPPTPIFDAVLHDLSLVEVALDLENCMPDEILYRCRFQLALDHSGPVFFNYVQIVWAEGVEWSQILPPPQRPRAQALLQLLFGGLIDPLRALFAGQPVQMLAEDQPSGLQPGSTVDEVILPGPPERHLGEEIEALVNQRRLQPLLRDGFLQLAHLGKPFVPSPLLT